MHVQQQQNGSDCGIFAIAFAKALLSGRDPTQISIIDPRTHLSEHLVKGSIPAFPSVPTKRAPVLLDKTIYYKLKPVVNNGKIYTEDILSQF